MGYIETTPIIPLDGTTAFNNNMGYIETSDAHPNRRGGGAFNNNMGYIETLLTEKI